MTLLRCNGKGRRERKLRSNLGFTKVTSLPPRCWNCWPKKSVSFRIRKKQKRLKLSKQPVAHLPLHISFWHKVAAPLRNLKSNQRHLSLHWTLGRVAESNLTPWTLWIWLEKSALHCNPPTHEFSWIHLNECKWVFNQNLTKLQPTNRFRSKSTS